MEIIAKIKWVGQMEAYTDSKGGEARLLALGLGGRGRWAGSVPLALCGGTEGMD